MRSPFRDLCSHIRRIACSDANDVYYFAFRLTSNETSYTRNAHKCIQVHIVCAFSADTLHSSFCYTLIRVSPVSFYLSYVSSQSIWIFITSGGRIRDKIYDVLLTNPSREVAWRRIVYLQMHTRSIGPTKQKERENTHTHIHIHTHRGKKEKG